MRRNPNLAESVSVLHLYRDSFNEASKGLRIVAEYQDIYGTKMESSVPVQLGDPVYIPWRREVKLGRTELPTES